LTIFLRLQEEEFFEHLKIKHEFLKKLHKAYQKEGIKIAIVPFYVDNVSS
jgi:hypothetical protein